MIYLVRSGSFEIRQELAKASISKYKAMDVCKGSGDRVRGLLQVYGAKQDWQMGRKISPGTELT